jgi:hypothetical protein
MTRYRSVRLHERTPAGGSCAPVDPVCRDAICLMCGVSRRLGESRAVFVARLRRLYESGSLNGPAPLDWWRRTL